MTSIPVLLRGHGDPLASLAAVVDRYESVAAVARDVSAQLPAETTPIHDRVSPNSHRLAGYGRRRPISVIAASGVDGALAAVGDPAGVELLDEAEFAIAVERAGLGDFDLQGPDAERVRGALAALRGSVGEQWVLDRLQSGELPVPRGTRSVEILPFTTPGVDLMFTDTAGVTQGLANIKVAATAEVVLRHFERYPDVGIVYATSDAAADAVSRGLSVIGPNDVWTEQVPVVVDISRSSAEFDAQIQESLAGCPPATTVDGHDVFEFVPWVSGATIAVRALLRLRAGDSARLVARQSAREGVAATAAASAAQVASRVTNSEPVTALVAMASSSLALGALDVRRAWTGLADRLDHLADIADGLARSYRVAGR